MRPRDITDGPVNVAPRQGSVARDGGNWMLSVRQDGVAGPELSVTNSSYSDGNIVAFLGNVLNVEIDHSLAELDPPLAGSIATGLEYSGNTWSEVQSERTTRIGA